MVISIIRQNWKCDGCRRPAGRRLALLEDYECYSESYVKCFWGLCDLHKSEHTFVPPIENKVITMQPCSRDGSTKQ